MSKKSILFRWFGIGKIPGKDRKNLEAEGIVYLDEGIRGKVYFRNYKAPGKHFVRKTSVFAGSVIITKKRFIAYSFSTRIADFPLKKQFIKKAQFKETSRGLLQLAFNAEDFNSNSSGRVEFSFKTSDTTSVLNKIKKI